MALRLNITTNKKVFFLKVCNKKMATKQSLALCSYCRRLHSTNNQQEIRKNPLGIQMLSDSLRRQIFKGKHGETKTQQVVDKLINKSLEHLKQHGLGGKESSVLPDVELKLPKLHRDSIDEHFRILAKKYSGNYLALAQGLAGAKLPSMPSTWVYQGGWTKYVEGQEPVHVEYPEDSAIVFDVEVCVSEGPYPTLATAVSAGAWYSWCSTRLIEDHFSLSDQPQLPLQYLIPLESNSRPNRHGSDNKWSDRVVVGHNVSFDRSLVKEQYFLQGTKTRFLDTMSLHMATSGLTTFQRKLWNAFEKGKGVGDKRVKEFNARIDNKNGDEQQEWVKHSSLNNLADVYALHNGKGETLDKQDRNIFVTGSMADVRDKFQELMTYCAKDVVATHVVFKKVLPIYFERFPHPVSFAAMLEMGQAYLPVNHNWTRYINEAEATYNNLRREMKMYLMRIAKDTCSLLLENERYKKDIWMWNFDWTVQDFKLNKEKLLTKVEKKRLEAEAKEREAVDVEETKEERIAKILATAERLPKKPQHMPGYPKWYRDLCPKRNSQDWAPGPSKISSQVRVAPKLLRLTWGGYPIHYDDKNAWGYLVPKSGKRPINEAESRQREHALSFSEDEENQEQCSEDSQDGNPDGNNQEDELVFPLSSLRSFIKEKKKQAMESSESEECSRSDQGNIKTPTKEVQKPQKGAKALSAIGIPECHFYRLPHKDGPKNKVGNPLSQDFLNKMEDGTLASAGGTEAQRILEINNFISFWRNARKRIMSQVVVGLDRADFPRAVTSHADYDEGTSYGAIVPRVIVSGTMTRRAVEPTWLTASNALPNRVGSEMKAMIQTPPGYHLVGADVDSQELWIAALLGDAYFAGFHGCTAFGWMNLAGKKSDSTDLHSVTASNADISRNHAKTLNYARIYGAGELFASRLLQQFNYQMTYDQAKIRAKKMMASTKGIRRYKLSKKALKLLNNGTADKEVNNEADESSEESLGSIGESKPPNHCWVDADSLKNLKMTVNDGGDNFTDAQQWYGGTESSMFNALEKIANDKVPRTPVLGCCISRALEPNAVGDEFLNSRINWVVQSSAVDYLHLMLVCMRWLFDEYKIDGRFCISIHDEVRYLVKSDDVYRAALALQITNLLTRSMFAYKLNMNDLPQSVAFFSAVDIDTVLRKEVTMDCKTPSNPHGMKRGYGIQEGEALDIHQILEKTNSSLSKSSQPRPVRNPAKTEAIG